MSIFDRLDGYARMHVAKGDLPDLAPDAQYEWVDRCRVLATLLLEAKREHTWEEDFKCAKVNKIVGPGEDPVPCDCGADAWNARVEEALK